MSLPSRFLRMPPIPVLVAVFVGLGAGGTAGQAPDPVSWTLASPPARGGDTVLVRLAARIDRDWYLYAPTQPPGGPHPMEVAVDPSGGWTLAGELRTPRPRRVPDRHFGVISEVYRGAAQFFLPVTAPAHAVGSTLTVLVHYQACTRTYCLPPRTDTLRSAPLSTPRPGRP